MTDAAFVDPAKVLDLDVRDALEGIAVLFSVIDDYASDASNDRRFDISMIALIGRTHSRRVLEIVDRIVVIGDRRASETGGRTSTPEGSGSSH